MTAAPRPKTEEPDEGAGSDADGWALLEGLRRRMDDQAAISRETTGQMKALAESIAALVAQGRKRERWLNLNSFVAYMIFTILVGGGAYFLYQSRAKELIAERDRAIAERDVVVRKDAERNQQMKATLAVPAPAPATAAKPDVAPLLKTARDTVKAGKAAELVAPLEAALGSEPTGPHAASEHYWLGVAYGKTNEGAKAIAQLQAAVDGDVDEDDARYQLAFALDKSGAFVKAKAEYDRFATAHPQSPLAVYALRRSATLARGPIPLGAPPAPRPPTPPAQPASSPAQPASPPAQPATPPAQPASPAAPPAGSDSPAAP
ncbi:MAG TPA: hypothetical protein VGM88_31185 [Kofleriaceae bacterium]